MLHLKKGVEKMDKKEIEQKNEKEKEIELKKEETKSKPKQDIKKQEYTVEEFAQQSKSLFQTKPECVVAAFQLANITQATEEQAKKIIKSFLEMEV